MVWLKVLRESPEDGEPYYWNTSDNRTYSQEDLPPQSIQNIKWVARKSPSAKFYYYHEDTLQTTWNRCDCEDGDCQVPFEDVDGWPFRNQRGAGVPAISGAGSNADFESTMQTGLLPSPAGAWVRHHRRDLGYWNHISGATARALPAGVEASLLAAPSASYPSQHYFSKCGETDRGDEAPRSFWVQSGDAPAKQPEDTYWIEPRLFVRVNGLRKDTRYEGLQGEVVQVVDGKGFLRLPPVLGGTVLCLSLDKLQPLSTGTHVEFRDITSDKEDLNGKMGQITEVRMGVEPRYFVRLSWGDRTVSVRFSKVLPQRRLWNVNLEACAVELRWQAEEECTFVDSRGAKCRFKLQLPLNWSKRHRACTGDDSLPTWPLLIFFHGMGGGSMFHSSKKALKTPGMNFAARHFVVCSPICEWKWKEKPYMWVTELVTELRGASWVDPKRVYLTGLSMGGMSTWMFAADAPDMYAAISPCAAHHHPELRESIAQKLKDMPVLAVHSTADGTCPLSAEAPLWSRMRQLGNTKLQTSLNPHDHLDMFNRAYCDGSYLFEWLLSFSLPRG